MARKGYPSDKQDQYMLRLPDGMRDRIKAAAEANNRSMNSEIVATLEEKYPPPQSHISDILRVFISMPPAWRARAMEMFKEMVDAAGSDESVRSFLAQLEDISDAQGDWEISPDEAERMVSKASKITEDPKP